MIVIVFLGLCPGHGRPSRALIGHADWLDIAAALVFPFVIVHSLAARFVRFNTAGE